jgi:hypothetical protein
MNGLDEKPLRIVALRAEISELGAAIAQLRRAGLDNAAVQLLLARKRAELDGLIRPSPGEMAAPTRPARPSG